MEYICKAKELIESTANDNLRTVKELISRPIKIIEDKDRKIYLRATLEIGNICNNQCKYCGMSKNNLELRRYQMNQHEIIYVIQQIAESGIKQIHLVMGESAEYDVQELCECIKYAKSLGLSVTTVLGVRSEETYLRLLKSGATRYILKFETSNESLYRNVKKGESLINRLSNILLLKDLGFMVGTGTIIDLPGTTFEDMLRDLVLLIKLNPDMASCSKFSPNQKSDFKNCKAGSLNKTIKFIGLMRDLLKKDIYIPSSSSLGYKGQIMALKAGANVISVNFTPNIYADCFSMYKNENRIKRQMEEINKIIKISNMKVAEYV